MTWKGQAGESGTDPGRQWLAHRPWPSWILVDPQTSLSSGKFVDFMQMAGIGVSVSPPEAHWQQGTIESLIRVIKNTIRKLREERPDCRSSDHCELGNMCAQSPLLRGRVHSHPVGIWL